MDDAKLTTNNKITKLYKQNENSGIDQLISPVAVVVTCIPVQKSARNRTHYRSAPESGTRQIWYQIGMTHSPEVGADFWRQVSAPKSGLCVISLSEVCLFDCGAGWQPVHLAAASAAAVRAAADVRWGRCCQVRSAFYRFSSSLSILNSRWTL